MRKENKLYFKKSFNVRYLGKEQRNGEKYENDEICDAVFYDFIIEWLFSIFTYY